MHGSIGRLIDRLVDDRDEVDPDEENQLPVWTRLEGGSFQSPRKSVFTRLEGGAAIREITNRVTGNAGFERTPEPSPEMAEMVRDRKLRLAGRRKNNGKVFGARDARKRREPGSPSAA